ncbi:MAG: Rcs stress response system protein RcsF [Thalassotalea sp.]
MKHSIYFLTAIIFLSSCAGNYQTATNLDKKNFQEYFAASKVKIYASDNDLPKKHQLIGIVEGQNCQSKAHHAEPDPILARTDARQKAYNKGANGIVFLTCTSIPDPQCHSLLICYGKAYQVISEQK